MSEQQAYPTHMTRDRLRTLVLGSIDKLVNHPWLAGLTTEVREVLLATRQVAVDDDTVLDKILARMAPTTTPVISPPTPPEGRDLA